MLLEGKDLSCGRGGQLIFSDLDFTLQAGEIMQIIGVNGCGKSSLLQILAGLLTPQQGTVLWQGQSIQWIRSNYNQQLLYLGHKVGVKAQLTVAENLLLTASLGNKRDYSVQQVLELFNLSKHQNTFGYQLSVGQRQKVALARLFIVQAKLWLLDEPFNALDQSSSVILENILIEHVQEGGMVLLTSHQKLGMDVLDVKQFNLGTCTK